LIAQRCDRIGSHLRRFTGYLVSGACLEVKRNCMAQTLHRPHLKTAQDARAIRTREALRNALLRLLERNPFEQITIRDICSVGQIGYTTFFRHFQTKDALLNEIAAEEIGELVRMSLAVADSSDTKHASLAVCEYVDRRRKLWSTLLTGGAAGTLRDEFIRLSLEVATARARPTVWPPFDIATTLAVSSTLELLSWWLRQRKPLSIEEVAAIHERVIITPIAARSC
jgi:AcrR family transcriptional regulator